MQTWAGLVLPALVVGLMLAFVLGHSFSIYDDAYIYFRYADNLRAGCGLAFNCGEAPVEGFTSPIFLALLTLGGALSDDVEAWSQLLGPVCLGVGLVLAVRMPLRREGSGASMPPELGIAAALAVALVLGLDDYVHLNAVSGLETGLGATVIVAQARAVLRRDLAWTCAWAVIGTLVRPEHGVFVLLLPLLPWARRRHAVLGVVGALLAIAVTRWLVFGELLPNTALAKAGGTAAHARLGLEYLQQVALDFPFVLLAPLALLHRPHRREHAVLLLGALLWLLSFLRTGGDHFVYSRLAFPLVPLLVVEAALGLVAVAERLRPRAAKLGTIVLPAVVVAGRAHVAHELPEGHGFANVEQWATVGRWLGQHHAGQTIATVPVGAMAYESGLRTLDLVGITSREVVREGDRVPEALLRRHWLGHERHATAWILQQAPDLIVTTKARAEPWRELDEAKVGFYADWRLLQEIKAGRAPYRIYDAEVAPGLHWLMFRRDPGR